MDKPTLVNHAIIMEDYYRGGERIREYRIEGLSGGKWKELTRGISVGRKKIDFFDETRLEVMRLVITKAAAKPLIRSFSAFYVDDFIPSEKENVHVWARPVVVTDWKKEDLQNGNIRVKIDLSDKINLPGQYVLTVVPEVREQFDIQRAEMFYNGIKAMDELVSIKGAEIQINQTAQFTGENDLIVEIHLRLQQPCGGKIELKPQVIYQ